MISVWWGDARIALRTLLKRPAFAAVAILTLALGIGATTAIFSVVNGVLLRALPYADANRIVEVRHRNQREPQNDGMFSPQDEVDLRAAGIFAAQAKFWYAPGLSGENVSGAGEPARLAFTYIDSTFFSLLGVAPLLGRAIGAEDVARAQRVVVLSEQVWRSRYGADRSLVGRTLRIDEQPFEVIGVMPARFQYPAAAVDAWAPISLMTDDNVPHRRSIRWLDVIARLKPGQTIVGANAATNAVVANLAQRYPDSNTNWTTTDVTPLALAITGDVRRALLVLLGAVSLVLLIACANVANLLLVRATARSREIAVRTALGASRARVIAQMLTENVVLSLAGGLVGLGFAALGVRAVLLLAGTRIVRADEIGINSSVLLFALLLSVLTGLLSGALPALRASRLNTQSMLREGGRGGTEGPARGRVRGALVVVETAFAVLLVIGASLMVRSFARLMSVDPGFQPERVVSFGVTLPGTLFTGTDFSRRSNDYRNRLLDRLREIPGVVAAGGSKTMPLEGGGEQYSFNDRTASQTTVIQPRAGVMGVSPDYFRALGIRIVRGREFTVEDASPRPPVVVINRAMADAYWPNQDVVSKNIFFGTELAVQIVGIVDNVRHGGIAGPAEPALYMPFAYFPRSSLKVFVRGSGEYGSLMEAIRQEVRRFDPDLPMSDLAPMPEVVAESVSQPRFLAMLLGVFGGFALLLAALGMYSVIAYGVTQRLQEIGIRIALGALPGQVVGMVVRQALGLAVAGVAVGLFAAFAMTRSLSGVLYEVSTTDPLTFAAVPALLLIVALLAALLPAWRATRVDPSSAFRLG